MTSPELINLSASKYSQLLEDTFNIKLEHGFVSFSGEGTTGCGYTQRETSMTREGSQPQTQLPHTRSMPELKPEPHIWMAGKCSNHCAIPSSPNSTHQAAIILGAMATKILILAT